MSDTNEKEIILSTCRGACGKQKLRISAGKFDDHNRKWVDGDGKTWNGRICPSCHIDRMKERMKIKRSKKVDG